MPNWLQRYADWLHLQWPSGLVENRVQLDHTGQTSVPGIYVAGDLTGIPLLKNALQTGHDVIDEIVKQKHAHFSRASDVEVAIIGAGVSGLSAASRAKERGLRYKLFERRQALSTLSDFPKGKPIYTYPLTFQPKGKIQVTAKHKEGLIEELLEQQQQHNIEVTQTEISKIKSAGKGFQLLGVQGQRVITADQVVIATGQTGNVKKLNIPGEAQEHVFHRLYDPAVFSSECIVIVGGGDSAVEAALACAAAGAKVTLVYRGKHLTRPKPVNQERFQTAVQAGTIDYLSESQTKQISKGSVLVATQNGDVEIEARSVLVLIGREQPQDFFERSGLSVHGKWGAETWAACAAFLSLCTFVYLWKAGGTLTQYFSQAGLFPFNVGLQPGMWSQTILGRVLDVSFKQPGFYYALLYSFLVVLFGFKRISRRQTPYVKWQTWSLMLIQVGPLFVLPYLCLPAMGYAGLFDGGGLGWLADQLFPVVSYDHGREYWRAFGLILAWPLFIWNVMTHEPMWLWLSISLVQTFVFIPLLIWRYGKGAYCGWICSCGALAETLGDAHREKMPHGPGWNKLNMAGQFILLICLLLLALRVVAWTFPGSALGDWAFAISSGLLSEWSLMGFPLNYKYMVDLLLAGIVGVGLYFWMSGRVWCRFFCPLAALMNIYGRFSRFRIFAEKAKCISCNQCTSVCHQGVDVMGFAALGAPMADPQCVRCGACVQSCPTGALTFGRTNGSNPPKLDILPASLVQIHDGKNQPLLPNKKEP